MLHGVCSPFNPTDKKKVEDKTRVVQLYKFGIRKMFPLANSKLCEDVQSFNNFPWTFGSQTSILPLIIIIIIMQYNVKKIN